MLGEEEEFEDSRLQKSSKEVSLLVRVLLNYVFEELHSLLMLMFLLFLVLLLVLMLRGEKRVLCVSDRRELCGWCSKNEGIYKEERDTKRPFASGGSEARCSYQQFSVSNFKLFLGDPLSIQTNIQAECALPYPNSLKSSALL